jgi:hypothetical protein
LEGHSENICFFTCPRPYLCTPLLFFQFSVTAMYVEQLYTKCLSEAAYLICDAQEAAIIDPLRDVDVYIQMAQEKNPEIEFHFKSEF